MSLAFLQSRLWAAVAWTWYSALKQLSSKIWTVNHLSCCLSWAELCLSTFQGFFIKLLFCRRLKAAGMMMTSGALNGLNRESRAMPALNPAVLKLKQEIAEACRSSGSVHSSSTYEEKLLGHCVADCIASMQVSAHSHWLSDSCSRNFWAWKLEMLYVVRLSSSL